MFQSVLGFISSLWFAIVATFGINTGTEQPRYEMIERIGDSIEIRNYAVRIAAEATVDSTKSNNPRGDAFRILAGYIFGVNKRRLKIDMTAPVGISSTVTMIDMTAPVETELTADTLVMRFFMPAKFKRDELPEPTDPRVKLIELPPTTVAVLRFSGSTDNAAVSDRTEELITALQSTKWRISGSSTAFFYNPPWTIPFLRTNEVVVPVGRYAG